MRIISNLQTTGLRACLHISLLAMANQGFFRRNNEFQNISCVNPCQNQEQLVPCRGKPKQNQTMSPLSLTSPSPNTHPTHTLRTSCLGRIQISHFPSLSFWFRYCPPSAYCAWAEPLGFHIPCCCPLFGCPHPSPLCQLPSLCPHGQQCPNTSSTLIIGNL